MAKQTLTIVADYADIAPVSLQELCQIFTISPQFIQDLVNYDIIYPKDKQAKEWVFDLVHIERVKISLRLHKDLEVNLSGVAVILDLLDQVHDLQAKMQLLEKHYR